MVENYDITLVGSSLGGFYSRYLSQKYNIKAVLINPCLDPCDIIKQFLGENTSSDGSKYSLIPGNKMIFINKIYYFFNVIWFVFRINWVV